MPSISVRVLLTALLLVLGTNPATAQGITKQQADEILKELRGIRQALERLAVPPVARPATAPTVPAAPAPARMSEVTGYMLGRPASPLTMVEFTDLQCPFCKRFRDTAFDRIKAEYIDKGLLRFVTRDFPLDMHANAALAARASRCAGEQDHFWDLRETLLANSSKLTPEFIDATAASAKLDMQAFRTCLESTQTEEAVQRDLAAGRAAGVEGTPTFIVGRTQAQGLDGVRLVGALPFENLDAKLKELLAQGAPKK
jgi:protein-disulfide isomerase